MSPNEYLSRPIKQGLLGDHLVLILCLLIGGPVLPFILLLLSFLAIFTKVATWVYNQPGYIRHIAFLPGAHKGSNRRLFGVIFFYFILPLLMIWVGTVYTLLWETYLDWYVVDIFFFTAPLAILMLIVGSMWLRGKYFFFQKPFEIEEIDLAQSNASFDSILQNSPTKAKKAGFFKRNRLLLLLLLGFGPVFGLIFPLGIGLLFFNRFRNWFRQQPGYIHHISFLPGMGRTSKRRLVLGLSLYLALPVILIWGSLYIFLYFGYFEYYFGTILLVTSPLAVASIAIAYAWLTGRAGFFYHEMMAAGSSFKREDSLVGNSPAARKANIERFLGFSTLTGLINNQKRGALLAYKLNSLPKAVWILLILFGAPALFFSYVYGGWIVGLVGAILSFVPRYRRWLQRQPGTINRLSMFRGWLSPNPFILAFAHLCYLFLPPFILFLLIEDLSWVSDVALVISIFAISTFPFGLPLLVGWFIRFWQIPVPGVNRLLGLIPGFRRWHKMIKTAAFHKDNETYAEGIAVLIDALNYTEKRFGPNHFTRGKTFRDLGQLYLLKGEYGNAINSYKNVIDICELGFGSINMHTANSEYRLGKLYVHLGHFTQAIPHFKTAIHTYRLLGAENNPAYARAFNNLGYAYLNLNHMEIAQALFEEAEYIQRDRFNKDWLETVNHLALLFTDHKKYETADRYYKILEAEPERIPKKVRSWVWINRAYYYQQVGEYEAALQWITKAVDNERSIYYDNHLTVGKYLRQLADILREMGDYQKALVHYIDARGIYYLHGELTHPEFFNCLHGLAKLKAATGDYLEAFHNFKQALDQEEKIIGTILTFGSENGRLAYLKSQHNKMMVFLELIRQHLIQEPKALRAADVILRRQSLIADMMAVLKQTQFTEDPTTKRIIGQLNDLKDEIGRLEADGNRNEEARAVYLRTISKKKAEQERLETELSHRLPYDEVLKKINQASWPAISDKLTPDGLLLQFVYGKRYDFTAVPARGETTWREPGYMVFTLPYAVETPRCYDLGAAIELETAITNLRNDIATVRKAASRGVMQTDIGTYLENGRVLYQKLIAPFYNKLAMVNHLFIVPDGMLSSLPFEILPVDNSRYLIDTFQISYLSTARDLLREHAATTNSEPLIIADPDYNLYKNKIEKDGYAPVRDLEIAEGESDSLNSGALAEEVDEEQIDALLEDAPFLSRSFSDRGGMIFSNLANTFVEGTEIAKLLHVEAKVKANANEQTIKNNRSPKVLHIATHGFFVKKREGLKQKLNSRWGHLQQQQNPLVRAGLALAGANRWLRKDDKRIGDENGILFGLDVVGLDLSGTKLVVLSACDTGLGDFMDGEGVFGLRRAFVMAGAHTLVMSMWKVPDAQTQQLMVEFYNELLAGIPRAQALRNAQLKIKSHAETAHPYFWGAFICQGAFDALPASDLQATST